MTWTEARLTAAMRATTARTAADRERFTALERAIVARSVDMQAIKTALGKGQ